jgi:stress-induced-phosphoprotein 1
MSTAADFKAQGNKHLQAGAYELAIKAYTQAIELDSSDHVFFSNRSAAYLSAGQGDEALSDADSCIKLKSEWPKGYSRKGAALHKLKRYEEAVEAFEAGLKVAPEDAGLKSGLEEVNKVMNQAPGGGSGLFSPAMLSKLATHPKFGPKLADPAFQAKLQMANSNPQLLMSDPEMMELLQAMMGGQMPGMGGPGDAAMDVPDPTPPPAAAKPSKPDLQGDAKLANDAKERGNVAYKAKKFDEAIAAYEEASSVTPNNILFYSNKAAVYIEMGEIDKAISICKEALEIGEKNRSPFEDRAKVHARIGAAHQKVKNYEGALEAYAKAQSEHYDAGVQRKMKTLELEEKKRKQLAYINPEIAQEHKTKGNDLFREGKFGDATKEYEEAIKRDPDNAPLRNNLAAALVKIMDFNGAKTQVEKSLDLDPTYVKAWAKRGDIAFFMKEYHKAMEYYNKGLALEPNSTLCKDGLNKTVAKVNSSQYGGGSEDEQKERAAHAMADPEIQMILQDPSINQILRDMQENPASGQRAMQDPIIRAKIDKLIAAGVLRVG